MESKSFEISIEGLGGNLRGVIVERGRGYSRWVRFGECSLICLLAGVEACCRDVEMPRGSKGWKENGRFLRLECRENGAGRFIFCKVVTAEKKSFSLVFPEGEGIHGGWLILAENLRALGVVPFSEEKVEPKAVFGNSRKSESGMNGGERMSYASVVKKNECLEEEAIWLQIGEGAVQGREEKLRRCLVGKFEEGPLLGSEVQVLKVWAKSTWQLRGGLQVHIFGGSLILFEFEDVLEAEEVLTRGSRRFRERLISLERWYHETGCLVQEEAYKEAWVRVLGLPLHLWSREVLIKIGDCCGGFLEVDEGAENAVQMQWARILVRSSGRRLPGSLQLVIGSICYSIQLWWEILPKFSVVVPRSYSEGSPESKVRGDIGGDPRASKGVEKDLGQEQTGKEDVSSSGGKSGCLGEGVDSHLQKVVAGGDVFGGGGRRACLEMTRDFKGASGPVGEGPIGSQQGKRGVGPVFKLREGLGWAHFGGPPILSEGDSLGEENPLGLIAGDDRAAATVPMEWIDPPEAWNSGADEALQAEAARYSSFPCPLMSRGARVFSSSSISCRKRAAKGYRGVRASYSSPPSCRKRTASGSRRRGCGSATAMEGVDGDISPLNMVLADGRGEEGCSGEEMAMVLVEETSTDEKYSLRQTVGGTESVEDWKSSCLAQFSDFLGMPTTGCEEEILNMLKRWIMRKDQKNQRIGAKRAKVETSKSVRELKRLECSINFKSSGHGRALFRESGGSVSEGK